MITKQDYENALTTRHTLEALGLSVPEVVLNTIKNYEAQSAHTSDSIYERLQRDAKFPATDEKRRCIELTAEQLLSTAPNAGEPCLLLGKIQCGKTDTFENIIGLTFDRGIDIAIVLTKGTNALVDQTVKRMEHDYAAFKESDDISDLPTILIEDIMKNRSGFNRERLDRSKLIVVAKKEAANLRYLIKIFKRDEWMREKHVLIVDDEADFASRNYTSCASKPVYDDEGNPTPQNRGSKLAKISAQIDELRGLPSYCRYLQVTATPYCLYLQPDGNVRVEGGMAKSFRPRFTALVPVHDAYVGGKQYFEDSLNADCMYSHLYHAVGQKCIDVLGKQDRHYLKSGIASANLAGLTHALASYLMATAIRRIQSREKKKRYKSSAVFHVNIDKHNHKWQEELIKYMLKQLEDYFTKSHPEDSRIDFLAAEIYNDFTASNAKGNAEGRLAIGVPPIDEVKREVTSLFLNGGINLKVVNSDKDMSSLLNREDGQLRLDASANIFVGGSILDRGITINNMLCFFYGRDPKNFKQDTVLQHARFYGARSMEDMAVTRLYTTNDIYDILRRMNEFDNQVREQIAANQFDTPYVSYDKHIKPCAASKIRPSNLITLNKQKMFFPKGMWTKKRDEALKAVHEIEQLITSTPGYAERDKEDGFFLMDTERAAQILDLISQTYLYADEHGNTSRSHDMQEVSAAFRYCANEKGQVWVAHRTGRQLSRIREDGGWIDAPADGRNDIAPARRRATDRPAVLLLQETGDKRKTQVGIDANGNAIYKNVGWNNAPFYWPVVMTSNTVPEAFFAVSQTEDKEEVITVPDDLCQGIDPLDVLSLTFAGSLADHFGDPESENEEMECDIETRVLRDTQWAQYIMSDDHGNPMLAPGVIPDDEKWAGVYSFNHGVFPFVFRPYKYLLLRAGRNANAEAMLFKLQPKESWGTTPHQEYDDDGYLIDALTEKPLILATDTETTHDGEKHDVRRDTICQWVINIALRRIVRYRKAKDD